MAAIRRRIGFERMSLLLRPFRQANESLESSLTFKVMNGCKKLL